MTLCNSCKKANVSCPVYPMETDKCVEYEMNWIKCNERLPELDTPVMVISKHYSDRIYTAMRYYDDEGWLWGQISGYACCLNDPSDYVFDDDYEYSHWMPLPKPPEE